MPELISVSTQLPPARVRRLREWAERNGYTLHRYLQKVLMDISAGQPRLYVHEHTLPSDSNVEELTETMLFQIPLELGQRLHSAAAQMRDPSDKCVTPSWLARQLLMHFCYQPSDILQRVKAEVDPNYVDHREFPARTINRAGRTLYPMPVKASMAGRDAVYAQAKERGLSATALCIKILDKVLPPWIGRSEA